MSVDWRSLDNPYSDPSYPSGTQTTQAPNSIAANLINQGITDLTPFKIVPFSWLVEIGKAITLRWQKTDNGTFDFGQMLFTGDEPYLPLGDCMIRWETSQTWVVLVKNESKYCTKIDDGSWKRITVSRGCNGTNVYWSTRAIENDNRNYNGDYKSVGDIFVTGDSEWWWTNTNTASKIGGSWGEQKRVFAAVDSRYLSVNNNFNRDTQSVTIAALNGDYSCRFRMRFTATSPFNTFNINGDDAGLNRDFNTSWPKYMFFDIAPRALISSCCSNTLLEGINPSSCGSWTDPTSNSCKIAMGKYCQNDTLKQGSCMKFCKTNDCDNELEKFCNAGTYAEQKKKYTENKELCSCFMPRTFYQKFDEEYYAKMGPSGKKLVDLLKASGVYGGLPECSNLQCKFGGTTIQHSTFKQGSCPNIQIQNCINDAATNNKGTIKAGTIDSSQTNNCVQQSTTNASSSSSPSKSNLNSSGNTQPPSTKSNTTLYLIIGGIILLLIIILVLILVLSGDDAPKVVYVPQPPTPVSQFLKLRK
jgi:hypothetical protein